MGLVPMSTAASKTFLSIAQKEAQARTIPLACCLLYGAAETVQLIRRCEALSTMPEFGLKSWPGFRRGLGSAWPRYLHLNSSPGKRQ